MLINVKMPTSVGILTFMSRMNFMLIWVEHGKSFITSGLDLLFWTEKALVIFAKTSEKWNAVFNVRLYQCYENAYGLTFNCICHFPLKEHNALTLHRSKKGVCSPKVRWKSLSHIYLWMDKITQRHDCPPIHLQCIISLKNGLIQ